METDEQRRQRRRLQKRNFERYGNAGGAGARMYLLVDTRHPDWPKLEAQLRLAWDSQVGTEESINYAASQGKAPGLAYALGVLDFGDNPVDLFNPSIVAIHDEKEQKTLGVPMVQSVEWSGPERTD